MSLSRLPGRILTVLAATSLLTAAAAGAAHATTPGVNFSATVEQLADRFPDAFGGVRTTAGSGETAAPTAATVYVVAAHAAPFLAALRSASPLSSYEVVDVRHPFAQLTSVMNQIAAADSRWQAQGVRLARYGPDVAINKVQVSLSVYTPAAAKALTDAYGSDLVSVSTTPDTRIYTPLSDRYTDSPPFFGGDRIDSPLTRCTGGWITLGNVHPANHWLLTAGHCESGPWATNGQFIGSTSTDYMNGYGGSTSIDIETIGPVNAWGDVWGNGSNVYIPTGAPLHPAAQQLITFDGSVSGMITGNTVTKAGPFCLSDKQTADKHQYCGLGEAVNPNGTQICTHGDSGGPVFQRTTNSNFVRAVGTISLASGSTDCLYTLLAYSGGGSLTTSNTHLDENSTG